MKQIEVELQEWMGSDTSIANAAWSSTYDKDRREGKYDEPETVTALVQRMAREEHSTPFESVMFRFWFRWPIFVDRQHMTHRIASHNGLSGRYRTLPTDWFPIPGDVQDIIACVNPQLVSKVCSDFDHLMQQQQNFYSKLLYTCKEAEKAGKIGNTEYKRVREIVRGVIGTASMVERTTMINLRSFANYQRLRNSAHAQKEIRVAAQMMLKQVKDANVCPVAVDALEKNGWRI